MIKAIKFRHNNLFKIKIKPLIEGMIRTAEREQERVKAEGEYEFYYILTRVVERQRHARNSERKIRGNWNLNIFSLYKLGRSPPIMLRWILLNSEVRREIFTPKLFKLITHLKLVA